MTVRLWGFGKEAIMAIVKKPEDILPEMTEDLKNVFGGDLKSVILYGSAVGKDYIPGKSDINVLVILVDTGIDSLERGMGIMAHWRKKAVSFLFMTTQYVASSLDAYPVEFLTMKLNHQLVFGENVLADLVFEPCNLRLQLERELKGKKLLLQQGFLESGGKVRKLRELIKISLGAFLPLFKALLFLRCYEIPTGRRDVIKSLALAYNVKPDNYLQCTDVREGKDRLSDRELKELFKAYHRDIVQLARCIDSLEV